MKRTFFLTALLIIGLILSQALPAFLGSIPEWWQFTRHFLTMTLLSFIMIEVGREFHVDLNNTRQYAVDYGVAFSAATFPWILVSLYFIFFLMPSEPTLQSRGTEAFLVGRFAAPTSAGVLFTMLAASGLADTWVFKKTRTLAIFDDLDTVLLMVPLQMLIVGFVWQLIAVVVAILAMLFLGLKYYRKINLPRSWPWVLGYSFLIVAISEGLYEITKSTPSSVGMHIEVLLPAFLLGCTLKESQVSSPNIPGEDTAGLSGEEIAGIVISGAFMLLVGISMPSAFGPDAQVENTMRPLELGFHVLMITLLSNLGKMFASFCYRKEAKFKERLAVSIALFPRGEVGAGILAVSLSYGITGSHVTVAFLSLALNLVLTGGFILVVKKLLVTK